MRLQIAHALADRGLGQSQFICCSREVATAPGRLENSQPLQWRQQVSALHSCHNED